MWINLRAISVNLLRRPEQFIQTKRTTYILRRKNPIRLNKLGSMFPKKLKKKDYYYELVEDTDLTEKPPIELVLTTDVPGIGMKGEKVEKDIYVAYRDLLLPKLAVYAGSPEAKDFVKTQEEKKYSSKYSKIVENYLATQTVRVILSNDMEWTLKPWHVKVALRQNGILTNEDCITIPREIRGPYIEIENKDFLVYLTMNKVETFPLRCRIYFWSTLDATLNQKSFDADSQSEALFPDQKELISKLIKSKQEIKKNQRLRGESIEDYINSLIKFK